MASWIPDSQDFIHSSQEEEDVPPAKRARQNGYGPVRNGFDRSPYKSWETWDCEKVHEKLAERGFVEFAAKFKEEKIDGKLLPQMNEDRLQKLCVSSMGERLNVKTFLDDLIKETVADNRKVFNDPIHGHIDLHPLCVQIIDRPEFQRLRFIKQLGNCYFVYPGASHNRFEHSIGVCYLAGQLVKALQKRQPSLNISDIDVLCVEIAGLCHDLGHGPFSHLFDGMFIPLTRPDSKWRHEDASRDMFHYMVANNNLQEVFKEYDLVEKDIKFIVEQVTGPRNKLSNSNISSSLMDRNVISWPYEGRDKHKSYLYEIVANKRNGIDVDKWDYFARDCHMLGIKNNFDHNRCIQFARVIEVGGEKEICSRDKEVGNLYDMFHTRNTLHRRAYQHRVTNIVDTMVAEAMKLADDHITFQGKDGKPRKMSESIDDMKVFSQLTDHVFFQILYSTGEHKDLVEAREILHNILNRKLYKCVGQTQLKPEHLILKHKENEAKEEMLDKIDEDEWASSPLLKKDVILHVVNLNYGMKDKNPIDNVRFYSKDKPSVAIRVRKDQVSQMLPETFSEQQLRIYCKKRDERSLIMVKKVFSAWCKDKNFPQPKGGDVNALELTPILKQQTRDTATPDSSSKNSSCNTNPNSAGKFKAKLSF